MTVIQSRFQNPDGFELIKKTKDPTDRFHRIDFTLPEHLNFGVWKIVARPVDGDKKRFFSTAFEVQNYGRYATNLIRTIDLCTVAVIQYLFLFSMKRRLSN